MCALCDAARNLEVDAAVLDAALFNDVVVDCRQFLIHVGDRDAQLTERAAASREMPL